MNNENFSNQIARLYQYYNDDEIQNETFNFSFQVTEECNLNCTYCYQHNKSNKIMDFNTAKIFIDDLLSNNEKIADYINIKNKKAIIIDFIGGEALLQVDLIEQILDYFIEQLLILNHPWLYNFRIHIGTNGTLYFNEKIQKFIKKYKNLLSLSITLDGNKHLHDMCRRYKNGKETYDEVLLAIEDYRKNYNANLGTKLTISPENIIYLYDGIKNFIDLKFKNIHFNPVFENVWENKHAKIYYNQLKKIIDYIVDNQLTDYYDMDFFSKTHGQKSYNDNNFCGGNGKMLMINPSGNYYPCTRYAESSLGNNQKPYIIGNVFTGIGQNQETKEKIEILNKITKTSQSEEKCLNCPIESGCSWCSAYNYEVFGTPNKRATFICEMHQAQILAIKYFYNKINQEYQLNIPKEWALNIIDENEYLTLLQKR